MAKDLLKSGELDEDETKALIAEAEEGTIDDPNVLMSQEEIEKASETELQQLENLGMVLAESRREAVDARQISGIEDEWIEDEEYYEGVDDINRGEMSAWRTKPAGQAELEDREKDQTGSTVFLNVTRPYTDAAAASVGDKLLPTDDRAWALKSTPIPDLLPISKGEIPPQIQDQIAAENETDEAVEAAVTSLIAQAQAEVDEAKKKADAAQKRIEDWHVECQFHAEMRTVIEDAARLGSGILKGPIPEKRRNIAYIEGKLVVNEEIKPGSRRIDPWNLYPDGGCGQNIHNGGFIWERDDITAKQIENLRGVPGYIDSQIKKILEEGPYTAVKHQQTERTENVRGLVTRDTKHLYEIWYFHGRVTRADLEAAGCDCSYLDEEAPQGDESAETEEVKQNEQKDTVKVEGEQETHREGLDDATGGGHGRGETLVHAQITMVNNHVIKAIMNPLDTGEFPYDVMVWQRRFGMPWGTGVTRQIRTPQRIINGAARNMMDNAGIAGGVQIIIKQGAVEPVNGVYEMSPLKFWWAGEDEENEHIDKIFRFEKIDMMQPELEAIINLGLKMAEDITGLPALMQGQMGKAPDTVGGMNILNNNASTVLRRIARLFDDLITEPHVRRYYAYLLQYGEDDAEKGDFVIDARGSSALVERDLQNQAILQMGNLVMNPAFGIDPKKYMKEYLKSQRLDSRKFEFDDPEWQKIVEKLKTSPQSSQIAVAQMRVESDKFKKQMDENIKKMELMATAEEHDKDRQYDLMKVAMEQEIEQMKKTGDQSINFDTLKTRLAETVMKLKSTEKLAGMKASADLLPKPIIEPPGKAEPGHSQQQ